jgi:uncharacterized protein
MNFSVLKATIDFFCRNQDHVEFIWHGGEPLLAGLDFYRKAVEFQYLWRQKGKDIVNFLQTNATLINSEWARFFAENNFFVGVSIDGPENLHNQVRFYPSGKGSYSDVVKGINLLRKANVFNGIICDISTINYKFPEKLFNFFIEQKIKKLKFARVRNIGYCAKDLPLFISPSQYADFMISIFDLWIELDDEDVEIRDIQSVVNVMLGGKGRECVYMGRCGQFVTVYKDGSICACDSFSRADDMCFGNVSDNLSNIENSINLVNFRKEFDGYKKYCGECEWFFVCQGGCARDWREFGSNKPFTEVCESRQRYFAHISDRLRPYGLLAK